MNKIQDQGVKGFPFRTLCSEKMGKISSVDNKIYSFKFDAMEIKIKERKAVTPRVQMFLCPECHNVQQHLMMYDTK
ncbi:MAG: hypothetical protein OER82_01955 [Nitrosopumilus sp.]|nr:hypothetical protein [Nitrosopumilus sp.]